MMHKQRKAFSMLTAIFLILLMSSVAILVMNLSGKIVRETTAQYQKEQAILYAKSYTEYAIMAVMSNDRSAAGGDCTDTITGNIDNGTPADVFDDYDITVNLSYIGQNIAACTNILGASPTVGNNELNVIVDTYVRYRKIDDPRPAATAAQITYHRRTLQKI
jgi:hypothetical protein